MGGRGKRGVGQWVLTPFHKMNVPNTTDLCASILYHDFKKVSLKKKKKTGVWAASMNCHGLEQL